METSLIDNELYRMELKKGFYIKENFVLIDTAERLDIVTLLC